MTSVNKEVEGKIFVEWGGKKGKGQHYRCGKPVLGGGKTIYITFLCLGTRKGG